MKKILALIGAAMLIALVCLNYQRQLVTETDQPVAIMQSETSNQTKPESSATNTELAPATALESSSNLVVQTVETNSGPKPKRIEFRIKTKLSSAVQQTETTGN